MLTIFLDNCITILSGNYKNAFSVLIFNVKSIKSHFDKLALFLNSYNCNYDIIILNEKHSLLTI